MMQTIMFLIIFAFLSQVVYADIYQCIDLDTQEVIFKDKPCRGSEALEQRIEESTNIDNVDVTQSVDNTDYANNSLLGKNLLKNAEFENKLIDWRVPIGVGWSSNRGINGSGALIIQTEIPPEDKYIHETTASQCVLLPEGEKFQLKGEFKTERVFSAQYAQKAGVANRVNVIWYESNDCSIGGQYGGYIEPKNKLGWQSLKGEHLKPAFKAIAARITIVQNARVSRGNKGYWDNISFTVSEVFEQSTNKIMSPNKNNTLALNENYIKNGAFNNNLASWYAPKAEWSNVGNQSPGSANVTFKSDKNSIGAGALNQCVNIGENTVFDFGASVKKNIASTQTGGGRIRISWNDKENCKGRSKTDTHWTDIQNKDGWQHLQVKSLIAPSGSHSAHIELIQTIAGPGTFSVFWDDVYFKAIR